MRIYPEFKLLSLALVAHSHELYYTTSLITGCLISATPTSPAAGHPEAADPCQVSLAMPACPDCECASACVHTSIYVTTLAAFCPSGTVGQAYTVTEVYSGMPSLPAFAISTTVPFGFTAAVETCTICGGEPVTATMTYPSGRSPYVSGMAASAGEAGGRGSISRQASAGLTQTAGGVAAWSAPGISMVVAGLAVALGG